MSDSTVAVLSKFGSTRTAQRSSAPPLPTHSTRHTAHGSCACDRCSAQLRPSQPPIARCFKPISAKECIQRTRGVQAVLIAPVIACTASRTVASSLRVRTREHRDESSVQPVSLALWTALRRRPARPACAGLHCPPRESGVSLNSFYHWPHLWPPPQPAARDCGDRA